MGVGVHYNNWRIAAPVAKFRGAARAMGPVDKTKRERRGEKPSTGSRAARAHQKEKERPRFAFKFFEGRG